MRNALRRLGLGGEVADELLGAADVDPSARGETLSLEEFARIAGSLPEVAAPPR
jgi:16S rRNA (adenine1518-N6/adenine1519-N6)-dimethyltransferase